MTADRPSPRLLSVQYFSSGHASFYLVFDRRLFPFPGISALNTLLSSSSLLITCYQFNRLSVMLLEACVTLAPVSLIR